MERSFRWSVMRRAVLSLWSLFLFLIFGGVFGVHLAHAETCTFVGGAGSSYENTANWDCGHVPALVDDVVISTGETVLMSADRTMNALTVNGTGILNAQATTMSVNGNVTISGSAQVTSTSGTINFYGATVTNNGSIGTVSGNALVNNAITNNGTIHVGSGTFNAYQLTNGIAGTIHGNTGILMIQSAFTNNGTFNVNSGTVWYNLVGPASSSVTTYNNLRVSNANLTLGANTIVNGTLTIDGSGGIRGSTYSFYVLGNVSMDSGTSVSSTSGLINMDGSVTSTGTIGTNTGDLLFEGIVRNDGTIYFGGYATATNSMTNSGTIQNNGQFFIFAGDFTNLSGGVVTSTGAALMFMGNTSSSGSISSGSGALIFEGPLVNHGTVRGDSSATFEFVGAVTSTGSIYASTATTTFSGRYVNSGRP